MNSEHLPKEKQPPCVCLLTLLLFVPPQSYSEPVDVKTSQPPQLVNSKPPSVFPGPSQAHSALYLSSHYHQQPGMNPHLTTMHPSLPRSIAPKANNQMPVTVSIANMAVSPAPPLQISPPLHQHLNMQQPLGPQLPVQVQPALHSPAMQQVRAAPHRAAPRRALDSPSELLEGLFIQRRREGGACPVFCLSGERMEDLQQISASRKVIHRGIGQPHTITVASAFHNPWLLSHDTRFASCF